MRKISVLNLITFLAAFLLFQIELISEFKWIQYNPRKNKLIRPWTYKYSNDFSILKLNDFFDSIRYFRPFYW